jgi:hypothetical protein
VLGRDLVEMSRGDVWWVLEGWPGAAGSHSRRRRRNVHVHVPTAPAGLQQSVGTATLKEIAGDRLAGVSNPDRRGRIWTLESPRRIANP